MAYTHTFEIELCGIDKIEGELDFDSGENGIRITDPEVIQMSKKDLSQVVSIIKTAFYTYKVCGEIIKIDIDKK